METPDKWVVVRITNPETGNYIDRVLAGWYGGYLGGDAWQMNSGIVHTDYYHNRLEFWGASGSLYVCYLNRYGLNGIMESTIARLEQQGVEIHILEEYNVQSTS